MAKAKSWKPNRNEARAVKALAEHLDEQRESILTCIHKRRGADNVDVYRVMHPDGKILMDIPASFIGNPSNPRQKLLGIIERICTGDLDGDLCSICTSKLLEGEEGVCSTCEAREVMGLLRLREGFGE